MYADDLALIASSPEDLQSMIDIVAQYAKRWRYRLNPQKSKVRLRAKKEDRPKLMCLKVLLSSCVSSGGAPTPLAHRCSKFHT